METRASDVVTTVNAVCAGKPNGTTSASDGSIALPISSLTGLSTSGSVANPSAAQILTVNQVTLPAGHQLSSVPGSYVSGIQPQQFPMVANIQPSASVINTAAPVVLPSVNSSPQSHDSVPTSLTNSSALIQSQLMSLSNLVFPKGGASDPSIVPKKRARLMKSKASSPSSPGITSSGGAMSEPPQPPRSPSDPKEKACSSMGENDFNPLQLSPGLSRTLPEALDLSSSVEANVSSSTSSPPSYSAAMSGYRYNHAATPAQTIMQISQMLQNSTEHLEASKAKDTTATTSSSPPNAESPPSSTAVTVTPPTTATSAEAFLNLLARQNSTSPSPANFLANSFESSGSLLSCPSTSETSPSQLGTEIVLLPEAQQVLGAQAVTFGNNETKFVVQIQPSVDPSITKLMSMGTTKGSYCVDCNAMLQIPCPVHGDQLNNYIHVKDTLWLPRARQSLPDNLFLRMKGGLSSGKVLGVFAKELIQPRCKFGPLVAMEKTKKTGPPGQSFLQIITETGSTNQLDLENEEQGNWMILVKRACPGEQHNVVAYQEENAIYFISRCEITMGEELKYWPSRDYALLLGVPFYPSCWMKCQSCSRLQICKHKEKKPQEHGVWICEVCQSDKGFKLNFVSYKKGNDKINYYSCDICNKGFTDRSNYRQHQLLHTGEKPFVCTLCSRAFRQKAHLKSHLLVHTKEKNLQCPFCDKRFARSSDLRVHEYKHTGEKKYPCKRPGCGKTFYKLNILKKHILTHDGIKEFGCPKCGKGFYSRYHLQRHQNSCRRRNTDKASKYLTDPLVSNKDADESLTMENEGAEALVPNG